MNVMAKGEDNTFVAVVNDTDPKSAGRAYSIEISGSNYNQFVGKRIGDVVDGHFVGTGDTTMPGYKLEITGGSDKIGTPMRKDLDGGHRKAILVTASIGFKGHSIVNKKGQRYRTKHHGMRKRRQFRGNTITNDTRQINLKVIEKGNRSLSDIFAAGGSADGEDAS